MADIPYGWATILAALIALVGVLLGLILRNNRRTEKGVALVHEQVATVKEQVANSHVDDDGNPIILRDDIDEITRLVKQVVATQRAQSRDIGGLRADIRQIHEDQTEDRRAVARLAAAAAEKAAKLSTNKTQGETPDE